MLLGRRHTCRRTYVLLGFFFSCQLPSKLAEWNSTKIEHMLGSRCNLKMHVQNLWYTLPLKSGAQNHVFPWLRNLIVTLMAYVSGTKHDIHNRASAWQLHGVSYIMSKRHELWSTNGFKLDHNFHPLYTNSAFYFIARLCRWRSANGTQPNFAKWWTVNRDNYLP